MSHNINLTFIRNFLPEHWYRKRIGRRLSNSFISKDSGFTIIEVIMTMTITVIVAGLFSQILVSTVEIYVDRNMRKNAHIDGRRATNFLAKDLKELRQWGGAPNATTITFEKIHNFDPDGQNYFGELLVGFNITNGQMTYQQNDGGNWQNQYALIQGGLVPGSSRFTFTTAGGIIRISTDIHINVMGKPMRMRSTIFPRSQNG